MMTLKRYLVTGVMAERKAVASVRWKMGDFPSAAEGLRTIENVYVQGAMLVSGGASRDKRFPPEFRREMQRMEAEAKEYRRNDPGVGSPRVEDLGASDSIDGIEKIRKEKEIIAKLENEALDPATPKEKRVLLMKWIMGLRERVAEEQIAVVMEHAEDEKVLQSLRTGKTLETGDERRPPIGN